VYFTTLQLTWFLHSRTVSALFHVVGGLLVPHGHEAQACFVRLRCSKTSLLSMDGIPALISCHVTVTHAGGATTHHLNHLICIHETKSIITHPTQPTGKRPHYNKIPY
jgi:hypothetical protein